MFLKKVSSTMALVALLTGPVWSADKPAAGTKAAGNTTNATKTVAYKVDAAQSKIKWLGKKVTGQHNGTISIKEGDVRVSDGKVVGGNFVIDATSIVVEDLQGDSKQKLTGHLKSDDFFGVEKHPTSKFEITNVENPTGTGDATHKVTGNLTIKGTTAAVSFPAKISVTPTSVTAEAKNVEIDRTVYGIRYGSGKFFQNLGDKAINDSFWLDVTLVATK